MTPRPETPKALFIQARTLAGRIAGMHRADLARRDLIEELDVKVRALVDAIFDVANGESGPRGREDR